MGGPIVESIEPMERKGDRDMLRSKLAAAAGFCLLAVALPTQAATIVLYDFDASGGGFENRPEALATNISASAWSVRDGTLTDDPGNPGSAIVARSWHGDNGNAFTFHITVDPGYRLTLDGFSFDQWASGTGPSNWTLSIGGNSAASGITSTTFTNRSGSLSLGNFSGVVSVILFGNGGKESTAQGTWRVDNFTLTGNVTHAPLPASLGLLASALLPLWGFRRRRS
jgi:hypothetical protein